jgi:hypothetical protein
MATLLSTTDPASIEGKLLVYLENSLMTLSDAVAAKFLNHSERMDGQDVQG